MIQFFSLALVIQFSVKDNVALTDKLLKIIIIGFLIRDTANFGVSD